MLTVYEFKIVARPANVGGGWRLQLLKNAKEVGGGVFPSGHRGYIDAREEGDTWLFSRPDDDTRSPGRDS